MWPKKKWRRHWNIKLNSGWSSGNSFNENQYTKTYTYIQIWCNHWESDRGKNASSFKSSNMISISRKHFYLFCEINFTKKKNSFFPWNQFRKKYLPIYFFDSDSIWYHDDADFIWRNKCARNFFFFEEIFFIKFNFFANKLRSN